MNVNLLFVTWMSRHKVIEKKGWNKVFATHRSGGSATGTWARCSYKIMVIWFISCILIHTLLVYTTCRCDHQNQKQTSRGAFKKRCSENIQQIYKRTPMPKCDFNKVTKVWVFSCKFAAYFQSDFSQEHFGRLLLQNLDVYTMH